MCFKSQQIAKKKKHKTMLHYWLFLNEVSYWVISNMKRPTCSFKTRLPFDTFKTMCHIVTKFETNITMYSLHDLF